MRLALIILSFALTAGCASQSEVDGLKKQISELQQKQKAVNLDLQEKCAKQAQIAFERDGFTKEQLAFFSNHYNEKLNKCFVRYDSTDTKTAPGTIFTNRVVSDAFEGKVYAEYMWHTDKGKKYWEVPPVQCTVTLPSGEEKTCRSSDEFDVLIKQYME